MADTLYRDIAFVIRRAQTQDEIQKIAKAIDDFVQEGRIKPKAGSELLRKLDIREHQLGLSI